MTSNSQTPATYQRNALAPALIAAAMLFIAPLLLGGEWQLVVLFVVSILALIVAWFALQAKQWWWIPVFVAIAVIWNPVMPFAFTGPVWIGAQVAAAVAFLIAGAMIKVPRAS